jgi:hypothetical protein
MDDRRFRRRVSIRSGGAIAVDGFDATYAAYVLMMFEMMRC